jgi:hypothetical protein
MKMQITLSTSAFAVLAVLAKVNAAPTTIPAESFAGAPTSDVYPPSGSKCM